jgi:hypothetical protein
MSSILHFGDVINTELQEIINTMYIGPFIQDSQKHGLIVCLPKHGKATRIEEFRPLTILNTDLKFLARIIAKRVKPWLPNLLTPDQHCCLTGTTIYDALATIRELVAISEAERKSMCILSLDFHGAFDAISYEYLEAVLLQYGYSELMMKRIMGLYQAATSSVKINGFILAPFSIHSSIRQGSPLSMLLYAQCINLLLTALHATLPGIYVGRKQKHTSVTAYADDVTASHQLTTYLNCARC